MDKLLRFALQPQFRKITQRAKKLFWSPRKRSDSPIRLDFDPEEYATGAFGHWLLFDFGSESAEGTMMSRFLAEHAAAITPGERTHLQRMARSCLRLYEIAEVRRDQGFTLRDLWTDEIVEVRERLATHQLVQWDLLAGRVIEGPEGVPVIEGVPFTYSMHKKTELLAELRRHHTRLSREIAPGDTVRFFKLIGNVFHQLWLDHTIAQPLPTVVTAEGDVMAFTKSAFDITDQLRVTEALGAHPACKEGSKPNEYLWVEETDEFSRILGNISVGKKRLKLETTSEARAQRGRQFLENLLGDAITFRAMAQEDISHALEGAQGRASGNAHDDLPPEVGAEIIRRYIERHYRAWVDQPIPALDGRTPRKAARTRTWRSAVIDLVKGIENQMERGRLDGGPVIDVSWLWEELGLERPK